LADERLFWLCAVVADPNGLTRDKIQAVVISGDTKRSAQLARPVRQFASGPAPTRFHHIETTDWLDRPDEHGLPTANRAGYNIGAFMDPVAQVHVEVAGWPEHDRIPIRLTVEGVARRVVRHVRLSFHDSPGAPVAREFDMQ
jgi:hypothetical protein